MKKELSDHLRLQSANLILVYVYIYIYIYIYICVCVCVCVFVCNMVESMILGFMHFAFVNNHWYWVLFNNTATFDPRFTHQASKNHKPLLYIYIYIYIYHHHHHYASGLTEHATEFDSVYLICQNKISLVCTLIESKITMP